MSGPAAIVPVKRFDSAKQRLTEALDDPQRAALAAAMLADVLAAVSRSSRVERAIVVTGEPRAEAVVTRAANGAPIPIEVLDDPHDLGHSEAARLGVARSMALGAKAVALLPGDCPLLDPAELDAALERVREGRVAIVPDRHGAGTNALLLSPPDAIGPAFGPGSCERHAELGRRAGHAVEIERLESLGLDLDTPADLAALSAALRRDPTAAPTTATALDALERRQGAAHG